MKAAPTTVRLLTCNTDKEADGNPELLAHLRSLFGGPRNARTYGRGVMFLQEVGHGLKSTRIRGVRLTLRHGKRLEVGTVGVHRGVAKAFLDLDGHQVRLLSVHGLHLRTSGRVAQGAYFAILAARTAWWNRRGRAWAMGVDGNREVHALARLLGGKGYGAGVVGIIISPRLELASTGFHIDRTPITERWSDHPAVWADIQVRP